jgi:glycylpeptide N-tetradecanoyltransferase
MVEEKTTTTTTTTSNDHVEGEEETEQDENPDVHVTPKKKKKDKKNKEDVSSSVVEATTLEAAMAHFGLRSNKPAKAEKNTHTFWDTQPVPKKDGNIDDGSNQAIDPVKTIDEIKKEPYPLPASFEWTDTDIDDDNILKQVYTLLNENYVEDDDNMFRFDYSMSFLRWALKPPGFRREWHLGVRVSKNKKLVGFISAIPAVIKVEDKFIQLVEINFLCVHKSLRDKRLAPVLIKEITRRVNLTGIFQAVYTAGIVIPKPIARCRYHHRSLNPKKLVAVGFSQLGPRMTVARLTKLYHLPDEPVTPGIRPLESRFIPEACGLLAEYLRKFRVSATFNEEEFAHWFLPKDGIVNAYVVEDPATHKVTDFVSFYTLPSTVLNNKQYNNLKAAYSFYNVSTKTPIKQLMQDALILAKKLNFDVFNCLDIFENEVFLKELKFGIGDGNLQYYLYNWMTPEKKPNEIGLVLL